MKLVIKRSEWGRGGNFNHESCLYEPSSGKKCCLGFYGEALGLDLKTTVHHNGLLNLQDAEGDMRPKHDHAVQWPSWVLSNDITELTELNDMLIDEGEREARIARMFAWHGVEVEFVE